jgi:hypothetical protein
MTSVIAGAAESAEIRTLKISAISVFFAVKTSSTHRPSFDKLSERVIP